MPWVAGEGRPDVVLGLRLHGEDHTVLVGKWAAEHDEAGVDERVHERGVRAPAALLLERT